MNPDGAVDLAIENLIHHGLSDISDARLEIGLLKEYRSNIQSEVLKSLKKCSAEEMGLKPVQSILTPKTRYIFDYRKAAIIDPVSLTKYLSLVLMAAEIIESNRIPVADNVLFSARFRPNSPDVFAPDVNYGQWREQTKIRANSEKCNFVVSCDIAAFYDRVNIHRIESALLSIGVDRFLVKQINDILMFWSQKDSYGLPVGNVASRILAEAALIDIDQFLVDEEVQFTRYVDDFRFFAPDIITAQRWMNKLRTRLFRDGLILNTSKTKIALAEKDEERDTTESKGDSTDDEAEVVLVAVRRLTGGYTRIARRFIMPAEDKHHLFRSINIDQEIQQLEDQPVVEFTGIQKLVISCLIQKRFESLIRIAEISSKYLFALDYFIDMLIKNEEFIPPSSKDTIADFFADSVINSDYYSFEWHQATIAKLLSRKGYIRKKALLTVFRHSRKEISSYPSVVALQGLHGELARPDFFTLRDLFDRCDDWERRQLLALSEILPTEERKAWARAVKPVLGVDSIGYRYAADIARGKGIRWDDILE